LQLHISALGANRARLCIVTHKIMHIELSIIAVLVAATLQLPENKKIGEIGWEKTSKELYILQKLTKK